VTIGNNYIPTQFIQLFALTGSKN